LTIKKPELVGAAPKDSNLGKFAAFEVKGELNKFKGLKA